MARTERTEEQKRLSLTVNMNAAATLTKPERNEYFLDKQAEAGHDWVKRDCNKKDLRWSTRYGTTVEGPKDFFMLKPGKTLQQALADIPGILATPQAPPRGSSAPRPVRTKGTKSPSDKELIAFFRDKAGQDATVQSLFDAFGIEDMRVRQQTYGKLNRLADGGRVLKETCYKPKSFKIGPLGMADSPASTVKKNGVVLPIVERMSVQVKALGAEPGKGDTMSFEGVLDRIDSWNAKLEEVKKAGKDTVGVARIERILDALTARLEGSVQ